MGMSSETEPENDRRKSRPSSSDYSDIYEKHPAAEPKIEDIPESKDEINSSVSVKEKISKFSFESKISSETEPEIEQRHSRPSSSDYSDHYEKKEIDTKNEDISEVTEHTD